MSSDPLFGNSAPADFLDIIFRQRFRTIKDRQEVERVFSQVFETDIPFRHYFHNLSKDGYQVGRAYLPRQALIQKVPFPNIDIKNRLPELESIMTCIRQNLPCLLVGPSGSGKTTLLKHIAAAAGSELVVFALNSDIDTIDLVGGYEQLDPQRKSSTFLMQLCDWIETRILSSLPNLAPHEAFEILHLCKNDNNKSAQYFSELYSCLLALQGKTNIPELSNFVTCCKNFMNQPDSIETARFEWVDGVLIKAVEEGKWLVLDNANLCSLSVLDRLNSLLEPNGFLVINEHCGSDGKAKIVKPHPDFRLFMTMDPRFGELSRAMRNITTFGDFSAKVHEGT
jgi:midasin